MRIRVAATVAASCVGAGAAAVAAGRYASGLALRPRPDVSLDGSGESLTVHEVTGDRVTLTRSLASARPGLLGLTGAHCHAAVGDVLATAPASVTRRLERVQYGTLEPGERVRLTPQVYAVDPREALGLEYADDRVEGELGPLPAWFVPGARATWVIAVHGLGTTREHPMVVLPLLYRLKFPVLHVSYRNDPGAPKSPDGIGHLGDTEWRDVDAAVRHAVRYGAEHVVLYGWSTGASMALRVADHSPLRDRITGLVLDSPVLDWQAVVRAVARERGMPQALLPLATRAAAGRTGLHAERLTGSADPARLRLPVLLAHGPGDTVSPYRASLEFARRRPDLVTLHTVPRAGHQEMWNVAPEGYEEALRRFLTPLM
ncbi:lysophospholipase [Streptomyces sp. PTM05]|uniref:Lysophospholipase n=1 Tax=Streptantibioticus parmotrematis TaxID=2873249 RepID=A0ABS7R0B5_9ACTN|nr:lysophospholipase [Streptantibioticus parmotrematis]MBY8887477.1 lysophospholipase [Streptantibioticus parmotrematis]